MLLHGLALHAASRHPTRHRPLVEAKRHDDGLRRTAVREQRHHEGDGLGRSAQAVKRGAFRGAERLVARGTQEPLVLARVDADVALAGLASGRACQTGAECGRGVHACPPCLALTYAKRSMASSLFLAQPIHTTVKCRATPGAPRPMKIEFTRQPAQGHDQFHMNYPMLPYASRHGIAREWQGPEATWHGATLGGPARRSPSWRWYYGCWG